MTMKMAIKELQRHRQELMDEYESCKCKECPYRNIWGKKVKHGRKI